MDLLIKNGAIVDQQDSDNNTAMIQSILNGNFINTNKQIVKYY